MELTSFLNDIILFRCGLKELFIKELFIVDYVSFLFFSFMHLYNRGNACYY